MRGDDRPARQEGTAVPRIGVLYSRILFNVVCENCAYIKMGLFQLYLSRYSVRRSETPTTLTPTLTDPNPKPFQYYSSPHPPSS